jgi:hypothetical protein
VVKAINKRCSKDLQAAADGYCKFWVKGRFAILILTIAVLCLRVEMTPTAL